MGTQGKVAGGLPPRGLALAPNPSLTMAIGSFSVSAGNSERSKRV